MTSWDGLNRRKFPRINYPCLITIRHTSSPPEAILTHTENIGIGGVGVIANKNINLFALVELEIDLLDTAEHIKCQGKVVWSIRRKLNEQKKPMFYDVGIEFLNISDSASKRLEAIVTRLVRVNKFPWAAENGHD